MLTLPESDAVRSTVIVWVPAGKTRSADAMAQVFQSAVVGMVRVFPLPPSTDTVSVRVVFCPSPPTEFAYRASNWYVPAVATFTWNDSELPVSWNPATKPWPVKPEWSSASDTPLRLRSSASHSTPMVIVGMTWLAHGAAVTSCRPARSQTCRLSAPNGPEPALYRSVIAWVRIVSQPATV